MCEFSVRESKPETDLWELEAGIRAEYRRNNRLRGLNRFHPIINSGTQPVVKSQIHWSLKSWDSDLGSQARRGSGRLARLPSSLKSVLWNHCGFFLFICWLAFCNTPPPPFLWLLWPIPDLNPANFSLLPYGINSRLLNKTSAALHTFWLFRVSSLP